MRGTYVVGGGVGGWNAWKFVSPPSPDSRSVFKNLFFFTMFPNLVNYAPSICFGLWNFIRTWCTFLIAFKKIGSELRYHVHYVREVWNRKMRYPRVGVLDIIIGTIVWERYLKFDDCGANIKSMTNHTVNLCGFVMSISMEATWTHLLLVNKSLWGSFCIKLSFILLETLSHLLIKYIEVLRLKCHEILKLLNQWLG